MKKILIESRKNKFALVDDEDFPLLRRLSWHLNSRGYPYNHQVGGMHRLIMGYPCGYDVDHLNGKVWDNQKKNLRVCTRSQNMQNQHGRKQRGIWMYPKHRKLKRPWFAYISVNKKRLRLGYFKTRREAALAYNSAAKKYFGKYHVPNKVY